MALFDRPTPDLATTGDVVGKRIAAAVIDGLVLFVVFGLLTDLSIRVSVALGWVALAVAAVGSFAYFVYFEATTGQTPGKRLVGVVVVTTDGDSLGYRAAAIRTVLRVVDALPALYLLGLLAVYLTARSQRVGDLAADTIVVGTKRPSGPL